VLPEELSNPEWSHFLCYTEWRSDYRYVIDNVIIPSPKAGGAGGSFGNLRQLHADCST
jgi:hypothetical protein